MSGDSFKPSVKLKIMSVLRKTSKTYKKKYENLKAGLQVFEKRVEVRFLTLCKRYPDVVLYKINDQSLNDKDVLSGCFASDYHRQVANLDTNARIRFIEIIEAQQIL
jgi:hypothetical protein